MSPCSGTRRPTVCTVRGYSPRKRRPRREAVTITAQAAKRRYDSRGTSSTVPSHWAWRLASASGRKSVIMSSRGELCASLGDDELPHLEVQLDHPHLLVDPVYLADPGVEEVLEQRGPGRLEVE